MTPDEIVALASIVIRLGCGNSAHVAFAATLAIREARAGDAARIAWGRWADVCADLDVDDDPEFDRVRAVVRAARAALDPRLAGAHERRLREEVARFFAEYRAPREKTFEIG